MNYRIEKKGEIKIIGKSIELMQSMEENFKITPRFWEESMANGTVEKLSQMMNTALQGLLGVSTFTPNDTARYYIAVASTKEKGEFEELIIPSGTWAVFYEEGPINKIQERMSSIVSEWMPNSGYEYENAPDVERYINPDPDNAKYEIWVPIKKCGTL